MRFWAMRCNLSVKPQQQIASAYQVAFEGTESVHIFDVFVTCINLQQVCLKKLTGMKRNLCLTILFAKASRH